ncbi:MAG: AsmA-like C-terminal region-containing protein, partial [Nitrospinaceae bacterium]
LNYRSGDFILMIHGTYARFLSDKAWLTVTLKSAPFKIQNSSKYLPLKVFSMDIHNRLHRFLKKGEVEVVSLNIEGPRAIFEGRSNAEIETYNSGSVILRQVDLGADTLPLKGVTGEIQFKDGVVSVKVQEAHYEHVAIKNLVGTVTHPLTNPWVAGMLEAEGALAPLAILVRKKWTLPHRLAFLEDIRRIQGISHGKLVVQGPLHKMEKLKWSGSISLEHAGFITKGLSTPVHNLNGNVFLTRMIAPTADSKKNGKLKPVWTLRLENFNGEFGSHIFREINGESIVKNGVPVKKIHGKIQLGALKAEQVIATPFEGRIKSFLKHVLLESGEISFDFQNTGPGPGYPQPQNKGSVKIRKLFMKHSKGFRPLKNLNATVLFDDHNIDLETAGGWYGDSPIELKGRYKNYSGAEPELILTARSTDFLRQDFAGIPFLETLEYQGPAKVDLKFHCTDRFIKLKKKVDLTRVSYRYKNFLIKPENISNSIEISASLDSEGRIDFKKVIFELEGSQVNGKGFLKSMDDPQFSIQLGSDHFKTWPTSQYIRPLQGSLGGDARFHISAQGNLRNLEEAVLQGSVHLKGIEYKPDHFLVPIKFNADMKFKNNRFQIRNGKLEAKGSKVFFGGDYQGGETPHVTLKLVGPGLDLNQLVSEEGKPSKGFLHWLGETRVFSKGSGEIEIKLNRFSQKLWTLPEVVGKFTFKDRVLRTNNLTLGQTKIDKVMFMGKLSLADIKNPSFDMVLVSRGVPIDKLFGMFGGMFKKSLTGNTVWLKANLQGQGGDLKQITQSLKGRLSFDFKNGRIHTGKLLNGAVKLFGIPIDPKTVAERTRQPATGYMQIFGDFSILDGVARTENFLYEEEEKRLSLVGAFDLNTSRMETVVGYAPFRSMDRIIKKIPILGPIVTGGKEGSLITTYYQVDGPFSDPKVESVPFKSISEKVLGTLEGIIIAPSELFTESEPANP